MASFQFACPYCNGQFAVDDPPAGQAVACPHCGGAIALPAELNPAIVAPPPVAGQPSASEPPSVEEDAPWVAPTPTPSAGATILPFEIESSAIPHIATSIAQHGPGSRKRPPVRRLTRQERNTRRLYRNLALMAVGMLVLAVAVVALSRW